jgi:hypothetical protein
MPIAVTLLSVLLMGMASPAACALTCSSVHKTPVHSHPRTEHTSYGQGHHHGCGDSVVTNAVCGRVHSCHSNCQGAASATRNSQVREINIQSLLGLVRVTVERSSLVSDESIPSTTALHASAPPGPQFPILRL